MTPRFPRRHWLVLQQLVCWRQGRTIWDDDEVDVVWQTDGVAMETEEVAVKTSAEHVY
jgi:hypothetical protein